MIMSQLKRAAGICRTEECVDYNKDIFLVNHEDGHRFICPKCRRWGIYKPECGFTANKESLDFYQVRVEFGYDPNTDRYRNVAIVTDESMDKTGGNVYTLQSPLIHTDKRALMLAEALLSNLMQATDAVFDGSSIGRPREHILCFDVPLEDVKRDCERLGFELENSRLRK